MTEAVVKFDGDEWKFPLNPKRFRTGSRGFHGFGKIYLKNGKRYQVNIIVVEIGSKERMDQ